MNRQRESMGSTQRNTGKRAGRSMPAWLRSCVAVAVAFSIVLAFVGLGLAFSTPMQMDASTFASASASSVATSGDLLAANASGGSSDGDSSNEGSDAESIGDDETPLAIGLDAAETSSGMSMGLRTLVILGIAVVVVVFAGSMFRVNSNIVKLKSKFR